MTLLEKLEVKDYNNKRKFRVQMYYVLILLSTFIALNTAHASDCAKGENCNKENQKIITKFDKDLSVTLDEKLKKYDKNRTNKTYQDKYGVTIKRNIDKDDDNHKTDNSALNDQIKKSKKFKKVYEGPKSYGEGDNLGFKLSIPLERDK